MPTTIHTDVSYASDVSTSNNEQTDCRVIGKVLLIGFVVSLAGIVTASVLKKRGPTDNATANEIRKT